MILIELVKFALRITFNIMIALGLIIFIIFVGIMALVLHDSKYEFIMEQDEEGNWVEYPVNLPCMEEVDDDYIKYWNEQNRKYKKYLKEQRKSKIKKFFNK